MKSAKETRKTTKKAPSVTRAAKAASSKKNNESSTSPLSRMAAAAKSSAPVAREVAPAKPAATTPAPKPAAAVKAQEQPIAKAAAPVDAAPVATKTKPAVKEATIEARIDVGFGNSLYVRGAGSDLSWDHGTPLTCVDGTTWRWSAPVTGEVTFKLLLNDSVWAQGEDLKVAPGQKVEATPVF